MADEVTTTTPTLEIEPEAVEFIHRKGGTCTIREIYPESTFEPMPQIAIDFALPDSSRGFHRYERHGLVLHVDRKVGFKKGHIKIRLGRLFGWRWLELPTQSFFDTGE